MSLDLSTRANVLGCPAAPGIIVLGDAFEQSKERQHKLTYLLVAWMPAGDVRHDADLRLGAEGGDQALPFLRLELFAAVAVKIDVQTGVPANVTDPGRSLLERIDLLEEAATRSSVVSRRWTKTERMKTHIKLSAHFSEWACREAEASEDGGEISIPWEMLPGDCSRGPCLAKP